jgi:hypothetical protein
MNLTKLVLIIQETDKKGKSNFKRLDTEKSVPKESISILKQPPIVLNFESNSELPIYIKRKTGFRDKTNALLIGEKINLNYVLSDESGDFYSASYCKI